MLKIQASSLMHPTFKQSPPDRIVRNGISFQVVHPFEPKYEKAPDEHFVTVKVYNSSADIEFTLELRVTDMIEVEK